MIRNRHDFRITMVVPPVPIRGHPKVVNTVLLAVLLGHVVPAFLESPAVIEAVSGGEPVALDTLAMTKINATLVRSFYTTLPHRVPISVLCIFCISERFWVCPLLFVHEYNMPGPHGHSLILVISLASL